MKKALLGALALALAPAMGCESEPKVAGGDPQLEIAASHRNILAGESATFTLGSQHVIARDAQVEWSTSGGDLQELQNGRAAQVRFDDPGTYTVRADLIVDGRRQQVVQETVQVRPVR